MSSYILHEHSTNTSAIDKYWILNSKEEAITLYKNVVSGHLNFLDLDYYKDDLEHQTIPDLKDTLLNNEDDITIHLTDGDYLVFSRISEGFGRRC